jgi:predicted phage terminase large subunit-like protein
MGQMGSSMTNKYSQHEAEAFIAATAPNVVLDWFHVKVIDLFVRMMNGDEDVPNLLVAMMPGLGKTELLSILLPAYVLSKDPTSHVLLLANNDLLAGVNSANLLRLVRTPEFKSHCPHAKLKETERDITFAAGDGRPNVHSASISGTVLGYRSTLTIGDDLVPSITASESVVNTIWLQWQGCAETRALPDAKQVIIGQRTGVNDIHSRVLERNKDKEAAQFAYFCLPATNAGEQAYIQYPSDKIEFFHPYKTPVKMKGQPYSFTASKLKRKMASMPKSMASAMYEQKPQEVAELPFKTSQWNLVSQVNIDDILRINSGIDLSMGKTAKTADYNAIVDIAYMRSGRYLFLGAWRMRLEFPKLYAVVMAKRQALMQLYGLTPLLVIEDKANGSALIQTLESQYPGLPLLAAKANSTESKYGRSLVVQPLTDAGLVDIYANAPGREMFCHEVDNFPQEGVGFNDDMADGWIHAMRAFIGMTGFKKPGEGIDEHIFKQEPVDVIQEAADLYLSESDTGYTAAFNKPWGGSGEGF